MTTTGNKNKYFFLFLFISTLLIIACVLFFYLSLNQYSTYTIYTEDSVSGLLVEAPVEYKGVDVGKVKNIALMNRQWIEIELTIKSDAPITKGTVASLVTKGLTSRGFTGFVYVVLKDKGTDLNPLKRQAGQSYPVIPLVKPTDLSLDSTLVEVKGNVQEIIEIVRTVLDKESIESLKGLIRELKVLTHTLSQKAQKVLDEDNIKAFKESLHNLKEISQTLAMHNSKLTSLLINTERASYQFEPFFKSALEMMTTLEMQTLPELNQTLPRVNHSLPKLEETTRSLLNLINEIQQNPSLLIRGKTPPTPGPGEEYVYE